jgi:hypothetical protein
MSQPSTAVPSSDEDEVPQRTPAKTPSKPGPLSKKTPPGPLSSKKRPLEEADAAIETPRTKRGRVAKRNVLLWKHFEQSKDPEVVICIANPSCRARIRRPQGSTSGMRAHFEARHPVQYTAYVEESRRLIEEKVCIRDLTNSCKHHSKNCSIFRD